MCAVFHLIKNEEIAEVRELCDDITRKYGKDQSDACFGKDIYPKKTAAVVGGKHKVAIMRWGFTLNNSSKVVFNARSEGLTEKHMFQPILNNRCLVPATSFFEYGKGKHKYGIEFPTISFFYLAALWRLEKTTDGEKRFCFTILTTRPSLAIVSIHDRMPVVLTPDRAAKWLDTATDTRLLFQPFEARTQISVR